jgi:hypothetical protein
LYLVNVGYVHQQPPLFAAHLLGPVKWHGLQYLYWTVGPF